MKRTFVTAITVAICLPAAAAQRNYAFDANITRDVLENYLSRAVTYAELLNGDHVEKQLHGNTDDNIRMLKNAWDWIRTNDKNGYLQMPGSRTLADPVNGKSWYWANTPSEKVPTAFAQEETIKAIWAQHSK